MPIVKQVHFQALELGLISYSHLCMISILNIFEIDYMSYLKMCVILDCTYLIWLSLISKNGFLWQHFIKDLKL